MPLQHETLNTVRMKVQRRRLLPAKAFLSQASVGSHCPTTDNQKK
jgi:hypothetical protein